MAISITCPGCQSVYAVPEALAGKTIRCKKCGETVEVAAPPAAPLAARPAAARPVAARPAARVVDDDDGVAIPARPRRAQVRDEDDAPHDTGKPAKKGSKLPLVLGGTLGVLVLGAAGVGALVATGVVGGDTEPTAVAGPGPTGVPAVTRPAGATDDGDAAEPRATGKAAKRPRKDDDMPPLVVNPVKPIQRDADASQPAAASTLSPAQLMSGQMDRIATDKVARATVLIVGEGENGMKWTGSGWFGMEPGLVFTNSHVLNMKAPDSKPPRKLTIYTYKPDTQSGARIIVDRTIEHSKIKILGVDRENDLAVLQILNEPDLPAPLKVRRSSELQVRQGLTVFGFPLTSTLQKVGGLSRDRMPEMSVRASSLATVRLDAVGRPKYVQIEGGSDQGNSGGPVVDAEGYVVGLIVIGINNVNLGQRTAITMCVPTEWVYGLLAGRVDNVEYDQPYHKGGKVHVPVSAKCLDPLKRLKTVGIGYWVGDPSSTARPYGTKKPDPQPSDLPHQVTDLKYDPATKTATGELVFPDLPAGRAYWTQPFYTNSVQPEGYWMPGVTMKLSGPPVDRVPTTLLVKFQRGTTRNIELINSSDLTEHEEGEGESKNDRALLRTTVKMTETVGPGDARAGAAATLHFKYQDLDLKGEAGELQEDALPKRVLNVLNDNIKRTEASAQVNAKGEMFRHLTNTRGIPDKRLDFLLQMFSDKAMMALQFCSIALPNKQVQPMEKWESKQIGRLYKLDLDAARDDLFPPNEGGEPGRQPPARKGASAKAKVRELKYEQKITYTYLGMRNRLGRKEAVVRVEGVVGKAPGASETASGEIKGYAMIDIDTGTVVFAEIESDFEVDSSAGGRRLKVSGLSKYKISRGSSVK